MSELFRFGLAETYDLFPNHPPTAVTVSNNQIAENSAPGTVIGILSAEDPDIDLGDTFAFELIDNAAGRFAIAGNALTSGPVNLDYEQQASWTVIVRVTDAAGAFFDQTLAIQVLDGPEAPYAVLLDVTTIPESQTVNIPFATITGLDPDTGDTLTFKIIADPDSKFSIFNGNRLQLRSGVNFEAKSAHKLTIRATDHTGLVYDQGFVVQIADVNEAPTDILLSLSEVATLSPAGTVVGELGATDEDVGSTFTYLLTSDPDNKFQIVGKLLQVKNPPNIDIKTAHVISVRVTDNAGLSFSKSFTIKVTDVAGLKLSNSTMPENCIADSLVGVLSVANGPSGRTFTYLKTADPDGMFFVSTGGYLRTASPTKWNYEVRTSASVTVQATSNANEVYTRTFAIDITNVPEAATSLVLSNNTIPENFAVGGTIGTLTCVDEDIGESHSFQIVTDAYDKFTLVGNTLILRNALDYTVSDHYVLKIAVSDSGGKTANLYVVVYCTKVWFPPTDILLSSASIPENAGVNGVVGMLSVVDVNIAGQGETGYVYAIAADLSQRFGIIGNQLVALSSFDYETDARSYSIAIKVTDPKGRGTFQKSFTITVANVNEAPTSLAVQVFAVDTTAATGYVVANLSATDPDAGATFTYSVVSDPSGQFAISATKLVTTKALTAGTFPVTLRVTDQGGLTFDQTTTITVDQGSTYAPEAVALFAKFTTQPTSARKDTINTLIVALKNAGLWQKLDLFYVCAAADAQAATINWVRPGSYTLTAPGGAPGFTVDRGFQGDGATQKFDSGWNQTTAPGVLITQNNGHIAVYSLPSSTAQSRICGNSFLNLDVRASQIHSARINNNSGTGTGGGTKNDRGFTLFTRTDSANQTGWNWNSTVATIGGATQAAASVAPVSSSFFVCGGVSTNYSAHQIRLVSAGQGLTATEADTFNTAVKAYMTAVGAQL